jgi:hypothetical protein
MRQPKCTTTPMSKHRSEGDFSADVQVMTNNNPFCWSISAAEMLQKAGGSWFKL